MKLKCLFIALAMLSAVACYSQTAFLDAKKLLVLSEKATIDSTLLDSASRLLLTYSPNGQWGPIHKQAVLKQLYQTIANKYFQGLTDKAKAELYLNINMKSCLEVRNNDTIKRIYDILNIMQANDSRAIYITKDIQNLISDTATNTKLFQELKDSLTDKKIKFLPLVISDFNYFQKNVIALFKDSLFASRNLYDSDSLAAYYDTVNWANNDSALVSLFEYLKPAMVANATKTLETKKIALQASNDSLRNVFSTLVTSSSNTIITGCLKQYHEFKGTEITSLLARQSPSITPDVIEAVKNDNLAQQLRQSTVALSNPIPLSQSELIDAVSVLIVNRFKQEVSLTFVDWLRKKMTNEKLLSELFPNTLQQLYDNPVYELPRFGKVWGHVLGEDFKNMPINLINSTWLEAQFDKTANKKDKDILYTMRDVVKVATEANQRTSLPDIVNKYKLGDLKFSSPYTNTVFAFLDMINTELYDTDGGTDKQPKKYWLTWNKVSGMKPKEWEIFFSLLGAKYDSAVFKNMVAIAGLDSAKTAAKFKQYLAKTLNVLNIFEADQNSYATQKLANPAAVYTGTSFWELQKNLFTVLLDPTILKLNGKAEKITRVTMHGLEIYHLMQQKDAAGLMHEAITLVDYMVPHDSSRIASILVKNWNADREKFKDYKPALLTGLGKINEFYDYAVQQITIYGLKDTAKWEPQLAAYYKAAYGDTCNISSLKVTTIFSKVAAKFIDSVDKKNRLLAISDKHRLAAFLQTRITCNDTLLRYAGYQPSRFVQIAHVAEFISDLLSASSSKDVTELINSYSTQANSYKIKRNSRTSLDINAYVGAYGSIEYANTTNSKVEGKFAYGLSVPLSISLSFGHRQNPKLPSNSEFVTRYGNIKALKGNSWTISASLFDLAAVVSYRFENPVDSTKTDNNALPKKVTWAQLFSPGLAIRWGIKNTPLCISTGVQYTPQLRNLDNDAVDKKQAVRVYAGLFFDIPLFNIMHR